MSSAAIEALHAAVRDVEGEPSEAVVRRVVQRLWSHVLGAEVGEQLVRNALVDACQTGGLSTEGASTRVACAFAAISKKGGKR